jgi:hypothetical protein
MIKRARIMFLRCGMRGLIVCRVVFNPSLFLDTSPPLPSPLILGCEREVILGYRFLRFLDVEGKEIPGMVVMVYIKKT